MRSFKNRALLLCDSSSMSDNNYNILIYYVFTYAYYIYVYITLRFRTYCSISVGRDYNVITNDTEIIYSVSSINFYRYT